MSYDPELKNDISLIMSALGALCLDAADRYDTNNSATEADRAAHKLIALRDYDKCLSERAEMLSKESLIDLLEATRKNKMN